MQLQLERRFGRVEFALRSEVGKPLYGVYATPPRVFQYDAQPSVNWRWGNSVQVEWWIIPSLSLGLSFAYDIAWRLTASAGLNDPYTPANAAPIGSGRSDLTTGRIFFSWAFARLFGLSLELDTTQPPLHADNRSVRFPFLSVGSWADNHTVLFWGVWFRTDATLARNWIER